MHLAPLISTATEFTDFRMACATEKRNTTCHYARGYALLAGDFYQTI
jgi:hypothetical protein